MCIAFLFYSDVQMNFYANERVAGKLARDFRSLIHAHIYICVFMYILADPACANTLFADN